MTSIVMNANARVGLLGNPSDIYGGRGIGLSVAELGVAVTLMDADENRLPNELFTAAFTLFTSELQGAGIAPDSRPFTLAFTGNVPFQSGLSGSSALLVAALRGWCRWFGLPLTPARIAELAWRTENEVLGIRAGPLDRLVQAHDGLIAMDFSDPFADASVERIDPELLPPLLLAWHGQEGQSSGDVHEPVFARFQAGDAEVTDVMQQLAANATAGHDALRNGDRERFCACVDANFELRAKLFPIAPADRELLTIGRDLGAAGKFPGSGGAVLFACRNEAQRDAVEAACKDAGHTTLRPTVQRPWPRLRAVFLAAGFATRLYPLTENQAKPLLEVGGKPMLTRIVDQVARAGAIADGVVVSNGKFHGKFESWQRSTSLPLDLTIVDDGAQTNETRLGAIRDLQLGLSACRDWPAVDGYLVLACDNLFEFPLANLVDRFRASGHGQLIVRQVPQPVPPGRYSEVLLDGERVQRFREKPQDPESDLSAIAVYLLPKELPELVATYLSDDNNPDAPGHFLAWLSSRMPLAASKLTGSWLDIGSLEDLERAQAAFGEPSP